MRKDVNIVTSLVGKGLEREFLLLKDLLNAHDVYVNSYHYTNYSGVEFVRADINLYLEVCMPNVMNLSRENWLVPNSEWWSPINDQFLPRMTKILCKTRDCERIWRNKLAGDRPERVEYVGFEARDLYDSTVERENRFLHVAGESEFKNTEAVIDAWKKISWSLKPLPLTLVTRQPKYQELASNVDGVTVIDKAPDSELKRLMNSHRFHVLPSAYEGFGHSLHEGVGCGALVITTAAPPMNEFEGVQSDWTVRVSNASSRSLATMSSVSATDVAITCCKAMAANENELNYRAEAARAKFLTDREGFRKRFLELVGV